MSRYTSWHTCLALPVACRDTGKEISSHGDQSDAGALIPVSTERAIIFHLGLHSVREPKESLSMGFVDGLGDATTVR